MLSDRQIYRGIRAQTTRKAFWVSFKHRPPFLTSLSGMTEPWLGEDPVQFGFYSYTLVHVEALLSEQPCTLCHSRLL